MNDMDMNGNMGYGGCNLQFRWEDNNCKTNNIKCDNNTPSSMNTTKAPALTRMQQIHC